MTELPTWLTTAGGIAAAIGTLGGLAGVTTLLRARAERSKLYSEAGKVDADAAAQLTDVALRLVEPLNHEIARQDRERQALAGRVGQLESDARIQHMLLVEHSVWDHLALARLKDAGVEMNDPPPLFPATRPAALKVEVTTEPAT